MKVKLQSGDAIEIVGPVKKILADGKIFISHTEFVAIFNGEQCVIDIDSLGGAAFPQDAIQDAETDFYKTWPAVLDAWNKLKESVGNK